MLINIFNWFLKITAWLPQRIVFNTKVYYQDKSVQGRHIKGAAIIASNHTVNRVPSASESGWIVR